MTEKTVTSERTVLRNPPYPWITVSLKDVCTKINDGVHKTPRYTEEGVPFVSVNNMSEGKLDFADSKYISYDEHKELIKRCLPQKGNILLSKVGTLGIADIINVDFQFSIFVQLALLKPNTDKILPMYLKYILNSSELQRAIQNNASGTTLKYIGINKISNLTIPLPPLPEQQKIASILSKQDELIQKTDQIIEQTQSLKKGLMQKFLTQGIGHTTFKEVKLQFQFQKLSIPENWKLVALNKISKLQTGYPFKSGNFSQSGIRLLKGSNLLVQEIDWHDVDYYPVSKMQGLEEYLLEEGDIVIAMDRPFVSEGFKIARISKKDLPSLLVQRIGRFLKSSNIDYDYLFYFLQSEFYKQNLSILQKGMDLPHISNSEILSPPVPLPDLDEQEKIVSILSKVDSSLYGKLTYKHSLEKLKQGLMQKLLTGKIRVKV